MPQARHGARKREQSPAKRAEIAAAIAAILQRQKHADRPPLVTRARRKKGPKVKPLFGYDLETTNIRADETPRPLYITGYGMDADGVWEVSRRLGTVIRLRDVLLHEFLTDEKRGSVFVAWNANRFDAVLIALALIDCTEFALRPYLTRSKQLRGLKVLRAEDRNKKNAVGWEFTDGIAMTGLAGVSLAKFVATFAPRFPKLLDVIDFEAGETFNPDNPKHRAYAMRDSEGLWHGMTNAQRIMVETFEQPLGVTMGGACIQIFAAHVPTDARIEAPLYQLAQVLHSYVVRGGFCCCFRRYSGPVWKYDVNQAYAAAMRDCRMPSGPVIRGYGPPPADGEYIVRIKANNPDNTIPFYYRNLRGGLIRSTFAIDVIHDTWITGIEHRQLIAEGWAIRCVEHYAWADAFDMRDFVDKLERLRTTCEGGPGGAIGTMVKATGNHSFGKTLEQLSPIEIVLAPECPEDCLPFYGDDENTPIEHVFYRPDESVKPKSYHQPQIGAWITAQVRMQIRRAALLCPEGFLYADTDCVMFDRDMTSRLDIDPARYGAFKIEEEGTDYLVIAKKVYTEIVDGEAAPGVKIARSAKGMHVRKLTQRDFEQWHAGQPPQQEQTQLQGFLSVLSGAAMYRSQLRTGTATTT